MSATHASITPSDTALLPFPTRFFYVGGSGDIVAVGARPSDKAVTFKAVAAGWWSNPWPIAQIKATGTTATNIVQHADGSPSKGF